MVPLELTFVSSYQLCGEKSEMCNILIQLKGCRDDVTHKKAIDIVIFDYLQTGDTLKKTDARNVLVHFFTRYHAKKNIRKYLCEKLSRNEGGCSIFQIVIVEATAVFLENVKEHKLFNLKQCLQLLNFIYYYIQTFTSSLQYDFIIDQVFPLYLAIRAAFISQLQCSSGEVGTFRDGDIYVVLAYTLQQELIVLAKSQSDHLLKYSISFITLSHEILKSAKVKFDIKSKCGLIMAYFVNVLPTEEKSPLQWTNFPILDIIENEDRPYCLSLNSLQLSNVFNSDSMKVILYCAVFNSLGTKNLVELKIKQIPVLKIIYKKLLGYGKLMTGLPEPIVLISRTLCGIAEHLERAEFFEEVFEEGLIFTWAHLEHFVESVCHYTKTFFSKLVRQAVEFYKKGDAKFLCALIRYVNSMHGSSSVRLLAIGVLCDVECDLALKTIPNVRKYLLACMFDQNMAVQSQNIYVKLMHNQSSQLLEEEFMKVWIEPVTSILRNFHGEDSSVFQKVVTSAFERRPAIFDSLFPHDYIGNDLECAVLLRCVHHARVKGLQLSVITNNEEQYWRGLIPKEKLELFMIHQDEEVRLLALYSIVECQKSTQEISSWEFEYLLRYFSYNVATQIPSTRKKICSLYKKLFNRYQASYNVVLRNIGVAQKDPDSKHLERHEEEKKSYRKFLRLFIKLLTNNFAADANFSRRSLSLELLLVLRDVATSEEWEKGFSVEDVNNLQNMLYDTYECNKDMAVSLLKTLPAVSVGFENDEATLRYFEKCLSLSCDIKPSKSLSASYMFEFCLYSPFPLKIQSLSDSSTYKDYRYDLLAILVNKLATMFRNNQNDVLRAAQSTPLHGLLLSIRSVLRSRDLHKSNDLFVLMFDRLAALCLEMKEHIMPVVCNPSPEGHVPENEGMCEIDDTSKSQLVLVYAWRTMKEVMLLLADLVQQTVELEDTIVLLSQQKLEATGTFFLDVFIQTKHRGVFEQAHVAFSSICQQFWKSSKKEINILPIEWLNSAVALCTGRTNDGRLCSTRRSAGLPFLILSIISTGPDINGTHFQETIEQLLLIAAAPTDESHETKMHCLNVLRFIFINSKLGDLVPAYVDSAAIAALSGFRSKIWGVRNSATLLFSALITRMFGVQRTQHSDNVSAKNKLTLATFYLRYPRLFKFLLQTLAKECNNKDSQMLHPILLILARLYPSRNDKINDQVEEYLPYINICIAHSAFQTRQLASRASVSLISTDRAYIQLAENFQKIANENIGDNECHGLLLQVWHLLQTNKLLKNLPISEYLTKTSHLLTLVGSRFSHMTVSVYIEVISILLLRYRHSASLESLKQIVAILARQNSGTQLSTSRCGFRWNRVQLLLCILINEFKHVSFTHKIVAKELVECLYSEDRQLKKNCLYFLIYLNRVYNESEEPPLFFSETIEVPSSVRKLVESFDLPSHKELVTCMAPYLKYFFQGELRRFCGASTNPDDFVLVMLLLRFYPSILEEIYGGREQEILATLTKICVNNNSDEIVSSVLGCISAFLITLNQETLENLEYSELIEVLTVAASPGAADFLRLTTSQVLVELKTVFFNKSVLDCKALCTVVNIAMVLLEDEELAIRNSMSALTIVSTSKWKVVPGKARSDLMSTIPDLLPKEVAISFLFSWGARHFPEVSTDVSEVYERGELNQFAENIPVVDAACSVLNKILWRPLAVSCMKEQVSSVTATLLEALTKHESPMMMRHTKETSKRALQMIEQFLNNSTFDQDQFCNFFKHEVLGLLLESTLGADLFSVSSIFKNLYSPVLKRE